MTQPCGSSTHQNIAEDGVKTIAKLAQNVVKKLKLRSQTIVVILVFVTYVGMVSVTPINLTINPSKSNDKTFRGKIKPVRFYNLKMFSINSSQTWMRTTFKITVKHLASNLNKILQFRENIWHFLQTIILDMTAHLHKFEFLRIVQMNSNFLLIFCKFLQIPGTK